MKRLLRLVLCALLLSILLTYTTYSWIIDTNRVEEQNVLDWSYTGGEVGKYLKVVTFEGISAEFSVYDETGTNCTYVSSEEFMEYLEMTPGESLRFKIYLENSGDTAVTAKLNAVGISSLGEGTDKNLIFDNIYFTCWPGEGYVDNTEIEQDYIPEYQSASLSGLMGTSQSVATIYTDLYIPVTENDGVTLECNLWFDTAGESIQSSGIIIDHFSFTQ